MTTPSHQHEHQSARLRQIAERVMIDRGLLPTFSAEAAAQARNIPAPATADAAADPTRAPIRELTDRHWASIDNDDSRDLDQLTVAEPTSNGSSKILVAIANVDALVKMGSAIDEHARHNTTSVYTAAEVFPMLPEKLSTDFTSLNLDEDRLAMVVEMVFAADGTLQTSDIYQARVRNRAKLAYNSVAAWLDGSAAAPPAVTAVKGLAENLREQARVAGQVKSLRHQHGALDLETLQARPVFEGDDLRSLAVAQKNRAMELIEDFMIAANGVTARYLAAKNMPSIRRVVRTPKRWDRIVQLALEHDVRLPETPDPAALDTFLQRAHAADPLRFPDLSLAVIKLLGAGEYVAEQPGEAPIGHFGLAVKDYAHSTAPNRRYSDLVTQRLLKAAIAGHSAPYQFAELESLATHLTRAEDAANKVERQVGKSAAAMLLETRIGERFDAIVTGASDKGTYARLLSMPVEGRVVRGFQGADVAERIRVQLLSVDVERGFIDFGKVGG